MSISYPSFESWNTATIREDLIDGLGGCGAAFTYPEDVGQTFILMTKQISFEFALANVEKFERSDITRLSSPGQQSQVLGAMRVGIMSVDMALVQAMSFLRTISFLQDLFVITTDSDLKNRVVALD